MVASGGSQRRSGSLAHIYRDIGAWVLAPAPKERSQPNGWLPSRGGFAISLAAAPAPNSLPLACNALMALKLIHLPESDQPKRVRTLIRHWLLAPVENTQRLLQVR
jgi:hypothetical protein